MGDRGFKKADSRNLPHVNSEMVCELIRNDSRFDVGKDSYGHSAISFVCLKRTRDLRTIKCNVCPEHKMRDANQKVNIILNEDALAKVSDRNSFGANQNYSDSEKHFVPRLMKNVKESI